jgi:hypothetical protein
MTAIPLPLLNNPIPVFTDLRNAKLPVQRLKKPLTQYMFFVAYMAKTAGGAPHKVYTGNPRIKKIFIKCCMILVSRLKKISVAGQGKLSWQSL